VGYTLGVVVVGAFLPNSGGGVGAGVVVGGGPAGGPTGVVLGIVVGQATRRPCGALIGRLVASV
jgi:hypothetical protein